MSEKPEVHLPSPSYWPILLASGFGLVAVGVVSSFFVSLAGVVAILVCIAGWALENRAGEEEHQHE